MSRHLLICGTLLLLAGCTTGSAPDSTTAGQVDAAAPADQACKAGRAQFTLGETLSAELQEAARVHAGAQRVRVVRAGQPITMDFDAERLNLHVDDEDTVTDARCG
ncbi:MAG: I78 family peptidase inhibitor [Pseudomonas sp.]|uniref:I78 family peptidase inhibitor n=1 Tax=Pseudomonas sp. TaxID=306 RepID=UPI00339580F3